MSLSGETLRKIKTTQKIWLLLDYDGTLADFAPTPDDVLPDPDLIRLVQQLADHPKIKLAIISGRRLSHIEKLIPLDGIWLAGSYGLEVRKPKGTRIHRTDYDLIRPVLEVLKPAWAELIHGQEGFYLEDKGWSLALHARFAEDTLAERILSKARSIAEEACRKTGLKLLGGHKFLEIAPEEADKGKTVAFLLEQAAEDHIFPIFIGDDDKDERAFPVVQSFGGLAGCVCQPRRGDTTADFTLTSPEVTRRWLKQLLEALG